MKIWRQGLAALALGAMTVSPLVTEAAFAKKGQKNDKIKDNGEKSADQPGDTAAKKGQKEDKIPINRDSIKGSGVIVGLLAAAAAIGLIVLASGGNDSPTSP